jgi:sialic acid synthase SpsE
LYVVKDIKKGTPFTSENLKAIRPGLGLAPKYMSVFIGKISSKDIKRGTALSWDFLA